MQVTMLVFDEMKAACQSYVTDLLISVPAARQKIY
jgi:hypothetical protein